MHVHISVQSDADTQNICAHLDFFEYYLTLLLYDSEKVFVLWVTMLQAASLLVGSREAGDPR